MQTRPLLPLFLSVSCIAMAIGRISAAPADGSVPKMEIDLNQPGFKISPTFNGLMTEEINHSYDGGLYAELIRNRSFKDDTNGPAHWTLVTADDGNSMALDETQPI